MTETLTVKEAAERLGVSDKLVYALCAAGKIVHERYGLGRGTIRIPLEALEEYRKKARVEHGAPTPAPLKHLSPPSGQAPPRRATRRGPC
jgi:excisionase family DNA binding protein